MNYLRSFPQYHTGRTVSSLLVVSLLAWAVGLPALIPVASAASLTNAKDTISDSGISAAAWHTISYTNATSTIASQTILITFDPSGSAFNLGAVTAGDIAVTGMTMVANAGACSGAASEVYPTIGAATITLTVCSGDTVAAGAKTIAVNNGHITNPAVAGSYVIRIGGTQDNSADTRVAIISHVTMTASVDTTLTFVIAGVASGQAINGTTTSTTTSATAISFGTVPVGAPKVAAQDLFVTTNAHNGYVVTVHQDQKLTSSTGATIDVFANGATTSVPTAWVAPTNVLAQRQTWGHYGLTSNDSDLNASEFISAKFVGNFTSSSSPRQVLSHTGPSDGTTQDTGTARVGWAIQIGPLQEAGNDYTNQLIYVATPTF